MVASIFRITCGSPFSEQISRALTHPGASFLGQFPCHLSAFMNNLHEQLDGAWGGIRSSATVQPLEDTRLPVDASRWFSPVCSAISGALSRQPPPVRPSRLRD